MGKKPFLLWQQMVLLLGSVILIMFLGMAGIAWYSLQHMNREIERSGEALLASQATHFLQKIVKGQAATIDMGLEKARARAIHGSLLVSESLQVHSHPGTINPEFLETLVGGDSNLVAAYFAPYGGEIMSHPPRSTGNSSSTARDLVLKPHFPIFSPHDIYPGAVKLGRPYMDPFSLKNELLVDAVSPVLVNGQAQGYVGVSLSIPQLIAQFHKFQPIRGSYSFLIDSQKMLVFGPPHARVDLAPSDQHHPSHRIRLDVPDNPALTMALENMAMGHESLAEVPMGGTLKYLAYHPLRSIDWRFGFVMPVSIATSASSQLSSELQQVGGKALKKLFAWTITLFLFSLFLGLTLVEKLVAPIEAMIGVTRNMALGDLSQRLNVASRDEMGQLANDFNAMADQVETMVGNLEKANLDLQAKNEQLLMEMESRMEAEDQLRRAEERYRSIFENAVSGILQTTVDGRILTVNPSTARLLGFENPEELMESSRITDFYVNPQRHQELLELIHKQGQAFNFECQMRTRDGRIIWVSTDARAVPTENGNGFFLEGFFRNITTRKTEEEASRARHDQLTRQHESRKQLSKKLIDLLEADRRKIAMELHDHIGQILTALKMDLEWALKHFAQPENDIRTRVERAQEKAVQAMKEVREIAYTLRPSMLDNLGLAASLENLVHDFDKSHDVKIHLFTMGIPQKMDSEKGTALYRVAQEAIWNAIKHSGARNIFVNLVRRDDVFSLSIEDDGVGFDPLAAVSDMEGKEKIGLRIIQERVVQVGGELSWESRKGKGSHLLVEIPL